MSLFSCSTSHCAIARAFIFVAAYAILCIGLLSLAAYFITHNLIDALIPSLLKRGLFGKVRSELQSGRMTRHEKLFFFFFFLTVFVVLLLGFVKDI